MSLFNCNKWELVKMAKVVWPNANGTAMGKLDKDELANAIYSSDVRPDDPSANVVVNRGKYRHKKEHKVGDIVRPNKYAAECAACGRWVREGGGYAIYNSEGKWDVHHDECVSNLSATTEPEPEPTTQNVPEPLTVQTVQAEVDYDQIRAMVREEVGYSTAGLPEKVASEATANVAEMIDAAVAKYVAKPTVIVLPNRPEPVKKLPDLRHNMFEQIMELVTIPGLNVWLYGPPGTGKSTIPEQVAAVMGLPFGAMSLSPQTSIAHVFGFTDAGGTYRPTTFRKRYDSEGDGGVFVFDEADNAHPSVGAATNAALANGRADFGDGEMTYRHPNSIIVGTANTDGTGPTRKFARGRQDFATLDRFVRLYVPIDETLEVRIAESLGGSEGVNWCEEVQAFRRKVEEYGMDEEVLVTPRATYDGAKMLAAGVDKSQVRNVRLYGYLPADVRARLGV